MGATMETQPTQHGLMQIFTSLGLATNNSLTALEGEKPEGKGFASLLSGYLPNGADDGLTGIDSNLLPPQVATNTDLAAVDTASLMDESLPLLGQALPLEQIASPLAVINPLTAEQAATVPTSGLAERASYKTPLTPALNKVDESDSTDSDASTQALADQGFYAQSLVSSLIGNAAGIKMNAVETTNNSLPLVDDSLKAVHVMPQQVNNGINSQNLTASELDEMSDEATDRFLGAEPALNASKPKKLAGLEVFPTPQASVPLNTLNPSAMEASVSLALALNEDPTTQSLDEMIDGEVIEKSEAEAKLTTLERKQDDQTLKLSKGQQAWGDAITERITMNAAKDIKQVTIHLDPPELGSLELKLQIKDDQQTHVQVQVQNPQVKEALESSAHRLREMLANQGLELSEFDVQTDSGRGEQSAFGANEQGQGQSQDSDASDNSAEEISVEIPKAKNNNLLDTFV
jgi:flagellar hook-length control protein FliK